MTLLTGSRPSNHRGRFLIIAALVVFLLFSSGTALSYYVNLLWFGSLGYESVYRTALRLQWLVFVIFFAATFLILYGWFLVLRQAYQPDLLDGGIIFIGRQPVRLPVKRILNFIARLVFVVIALATGASMMEEWPTFALYWYAPASPASAVDPIFGRPLHFYLFTLPVWQLISGWLLSIAIIGVIVAFFFVLITGTFHILSAYRGRSIPPSWRGVSIAVAFLLLVIALEVYLSRFGALFREHTIFSGVSYTDAHITLTGLLIVCAALVIGAIIALLNVVSAPRVRWLAMAPVPAIFCYVVVLLVAWYVGSFIVKPNELDRERPYIAHNIELTRQAYGLDLVSRHEFPAEVSVEATDAASNQATLQNIRLWDWRAFRILSARFRRSALITIFPISI